MVESRIERGDKIETERHSYISSRVLYPDVFATAGRSHWAIEKNLHWTLDMTFNEDQSGLRVGRWARYMAVVCHFAFNRYDKLTTSDLSSDGEKGLPGIRNTSLKILDPLRC